jgi:hypothetical protein
MVSALALAAVLASARRILPAAPARGAGLDLVETVGACRRRPLSADACPHRTCRIGAEVTVEAEVEAEVEVGAGACLGAEAEAAIVASISQEVPVAEGRAATVEAARICRASMATLGAGRRLGRDLRRARGRGHGHFLEIVGTESVVKIDTANRHHLAASKTRTEQVWAIHPD